MTGTVKEAPSAKIQVNPRRVVLEKTEPGMVQNQVFSVKNTGTVPLIITKIYAKKSGVLYFDGTQEGNVIIGPDRIKRIELPLKAESNEDGPGEMIVIVCNARNALKGNYILMVLSR